jgi:putative MATE family efflux protein
VRVAAPSCKIARIVLDGRGRRRDAVSWGDDLGETKRGLIAYNRWAKPFVSDSQAHLAQSQRNCPRTHSRIPRCLIGIVMDRSERLGQASIPRLLLGFSLPAIVGMMAQASYNLIDRIFVGHAIGSEGIAGTTVAFPFMLVVLAFGMMIGIGGTTLISLRLGEGRKVDAELVLGNTAVLLVVVSVFITAVGLLWLNPILTIFGASNTVLPYARDYLRIIVLGTVFQTVAFGLNAAIRGEGNPKIAMLSMLISVLLNAILAPIFIFGFSWGMKGAALATVISQAVVAVWVVSYFLGRKSVLRLRFRNLRLNSDVCRQIVVFGSPPFAMQLAASVVQSVLLYQLGRYGGDLAISVMGVLYAMFMMVAMPIFGVNQGSQPIIGYNYGAERFDRVKRTLELAILAATGIAALGFSVMMLFPGQVIRLFNDEDRALLALGTHAIRVAAIMMPLVGFQVVSGSYFQAIGKPKTALLLMLSRQVFLLIPAALILPLFFGLNGVWIAMPASDFGSSLLTGICLFIELRELKVNHQQTQSANENADYTAIIG